VIALKAPSLAPLVPQIAALLGPLDRRAAGDEWRALVVPARGRADEPPLESVDPGGRLLAALPVERRCSAALFTSPPRAPSPAWCGTASANGSSSANRRAAIRRASARSARRSPHRASRPKPRPDVRREVWYKLWGNMTMNPVSALTGAESTAILDDPLVHAFMMRTMAEAAAIGERIGCPIAQSGEERMGLARKLGSFKTSMLQDALAGRPIELDAPRHRGPRDRRPGRRGDAEHRRPARPDPADGAASAASTLPFGVAPRVDGVAPAHRRAPPEGPVLSRHGSCSTLPR
jgi:2-dehydropantoate 2-reductase